MKATTMRVIDRIATHAPRRQIGDGDTIGLGTWVQYRPWVLGSDDTYVPGNVVHHGQVWQIVTGGARPLYVIADGHTFHTASPRDLTVQGQACATLPFTITTAA